MIPNLIMAFVLIKALNVTGLLDLIGRVCAPVMELFGLPGEAATILASAWLSIGGSVGVAAALCKQPATVAGFTAITIVMLH